LAVFHRFDSLSLTFKNIPREFFSYLGLTKRRLKKRIAFNESWSFADSLFGGGHSVP